MIRENGRVEIFETASGVTLPIYEWCAHKIAHKVAFIQDDKYIATYGIDDIGETVKVWETNGKLVQKISIPLNAKSLGLLRNSVWFTFLERTGITSSKVLRIISFYDENAIIDFQIESNSVWAGFDKPLLVAFAKNNEISILALPSSKLIGKISLDSIKTNRILFSISTEQKEPWLYVKTQKHFQLYQIKADESIILRRNLERLSIDNLYGIATIDEPTIIVGGSYHESAIYIWDESSDIPTTLKIKSNLTETNITGCTNISEENLSWLKERGAIGEPRSIEKKDLK